MTDFSVEKWGPMVDSGAVFQVDQWGDQPNPALDALKGAGVGLAQGGIGLAGLPGDLQKGADWVGAKMLPPQAPGTTPTRNAGLGQAPGGADIQSAIEKWTGPFYQPQTDPGRFANAAGKMVPGAVLGPGGIGRNAMLYGVLPGIAGEAATYAVPEQYKDAARIGTSVVAGGTALPVTRAFGNRVAAGSTARDIGKTLTAAGDNTSINAASVNKVASNIIDDSLTPAGIRTRAGDLGPEAMLLDMGEQLKGRADAMASQPGKGQTKVIGAVKDRTGEFGAKTAERVKDTLDSLIGASPDAVSYIRNAEKIVDSYARPAYQKVMAAHPVVWDATLKTLLDRPAIRQAFDNVETLAANYGQQVSGATPSLAAWDYVKKGLDARINAYMRNGYDALGGEAKADLGGLKDARKALVDHLDNVTAGAYANARKISATKQSMRESFDEGRSAFNTQQLPEEFADVLSNMSVVDRKMAEAGFRREIERVIDVARNDGASARRLLDTNQNLQKIEAIFGKKAAEGIERRINTENTFQAATNDITGNSRTAVRQALRADTKDPTIGGSSHVTLPGMAVAAGRAGLNYTMRNGMRDTREGISAMLTSSGQPMHDISDALYKYTQRISEQSTPERMNRARLILNSIISGKSN